MKKIRYIQLTLTVFIILLIGIVKWENRQKEIESPIRINEICNINETIIYDHKGNFYAYVELYNESSTDIDMNGYYISDSKDNLMKYMFQDVVVPAEGYALVWIDKDITRFSIKATENIYISNESGKIIDSVTIPNIQRDLAYAKNSSSQKWENNVKPTPGAENISHSLEETEKVYVEAPYFSETPGFFEEPFYLELKSIGDCKIYYTLDGTKPTRESLIYKEPILIEDVSSKENIYASIKEISLLDVYIPDYPVEKCNVVRAIAVDSQGNYSNEISGSFFVGYDDKEGFEDICIASIITNPENLFSDDRGIYVVGNIGWKNYNPEIRPQMQVTNYTVEGKGWQREANIEIFNKENIDVYNEEIDISIHGGWSTSHNQKSFNLYFMDEDEKEKKLLGNNIETLMIRAGGARDTFSTKIRDVMGQELVKNRNITILESIPCQVFINGEYWGLYNLQERVDRNLIERKFGVNKEDVIVVKIRTVVEASDDYYALYQRVVDYAKEHDLSKSYNYKVMESMIDIQSYIDYHCFQIYIANCDSVANNYAMWRTLPIKGDEYYDGKWRWILYDTDDSMGMVEEHSMYDADSFWRGHWAVAPMNDELFSALIKNEDFRRQFIDTFMEMADENFANEKVQKVIDRYYEEYADAMVVSQKRFYDKNYCEEMFKQEVDVIRTFFEKRREPILEYMKQYLGE